VGARSPDHADAAIWGLAELMLDPEPVPDIRFVDLAKFSR
jgi:phage terminase large subunit-like protein